jgi:archaellin
MDLQEINKIIHEYDQLINLVKSKINIISLLDSEYSTYSEIEQILFSNSNVVVICNSHNMGYNSTETFEFPIKWLVESEENLESIVLNAKELRVQQKKLKEKELATKKELKEKYEYERLRKKFESENS